jgi:cytochrome P450/NADPH-cytochrome P450 reductase
LDPTATILIHPVDTAPPHLPLGQPVPLGEVLGSCVELQAVASRHDLAVLAQHALCPPEKARLLALAGDDPDSQARYRDEIFQPRESVLDLLDEYPSCQVPFETYLGMLPALRPRYYSIASSPRVAPDRVAVAVAVVEGPARSGHGIYHGVGSTDLAGRQLLGEVPAFVRKPSLSFHPPENPHQPMILVGAGTGIAPFRGFLQERSALKERGVPIGECLLFFGCRDPHADFLYEDELRDFEARDIARLHVAFSRLPGRPKRYVQDEIRAASDAVWSLLESGASVYVSGDASRMAPDVRQASRDVYRAKTGASDVEAARWLADLVAADRYVEDIWSGPR